MNCISPSSEHGPMPAIADESLCIRCKARFTGLLLRAPEAGAHAAAFIAPDARIVGLSNSGSRNSTIPHVTDDQAVAMRDRLFRILAGLTIQWASYLPGTPPPILPARVPLGFRGIPTRLPRRIGAGQTGGAIRRCSAWLLRNLDAILSARPIGDPRSELLEYTLVDLSDAMSAVESVFPLDDSCLTRSLSHPGCGGNVTAQPPQHFGSRVQSNCSQCGTEFIHEDWQSMTARAAAANPRESANRTDAILRNLDRRMREQSTG